MSHLVPCPECGRHVRTHESACPFCDVALSLASTPPHVLPKRRLSRAALFAFGATIVGATTLGCSDSDDDGGTGGSAGTAGSSGSGGAGGAGGTAGAAGSGGTAGGAGSAGAGGMAGDDGGAMPLYGAAP